jgi:MFS family permease
MAAPALDNIGSDLHIPNGVQLQLVLSIFVLAYSFGPFVLSPSSEIWGRVRIIQVGNLVFIIFNTLCGFATTQAQLTAFRLIAGFGGSATLGVSRRFVIVVQSNC